MKGEHPVRGRTSWAWKVSVYNVESRESAEFVVHAAHRAEAKQSVVPHIGFEPTDWFVRTHDPAGDKRMEEATAEVTSFVSEALFIALVAGLLVFFTAPLWKPALWLRDKLSS